jgi:excinuclease ABC subunit B
LDADKQGFLRSKVSLIQTMGRAARNVAGKVILYADFETQAMKEALAEVARRRKVQTEYNEKHGIIPRTIQKPIREALVVQVEEEELTDEGLTPADAKKTIAKLKKQMREYAKILEFERAAQIRNRIEDLRKRFDLS